MNYRYVLAGFLSLLYCVSHSITGTGTQTTGSIPLTFVEDTTISSYKYVTDYRLAQFNSDTTTNCAVECRQQTTCVMFAYVSDLKSCMLYDDEITNASNYVTSSAKTRFYRAYCSDLSGYLYYRTISMCLRHQTDRLTFEEARDMCWNEGATLHEPKTQALVDFYKPYATKRFWVGGYADINQQGWFWFTSPDRMDNQTGLELWAPGDATDNYAFPCLELKTTNVIYYLSDRNCTWIREFYCQIEY